MRLTAVLFVVFALAGCATLAPMLDAVTPQPADGAATYLVELCQQAPADRAALLDTMNATIAPNVLKVTCAAR